MNPLRVLVVDDAADLRFLLSQAIELDGRMQVSEAVGDGRAAIAAVGRFRPDVVLMDVAMPIMDGVTATRELVRQHPALPIVLFTGYADDVLAETAAAAGAAAIIGKDRPVREVVAELFAHADPTGVA